MVRHARTTERHRLELQRNAEIALGASASIIAAHAQVMAAFQFSFPNHNPNRHEPMDQLGRQWQLAHIWMRDVNLASTEKTERGLLNRLASREVADHHLNKYFAMLEMQLPQELREMADPTFKQRGAKC